MNKDAPTTPTPPSADRQVDEDTALQMHEPIDRALEHPRDGREPVPMMWILAIILIVLFGGWYLGNYHAGFRANVLDGPAAFPNPYVIGEDEEAQLDLPTLGRRVFNNCMSCHGQHGQGAIGQYPPLGGSQWVVGPPERLTRILLDGLQGPVEVNGQWYNGTMPAWRRLSDRQLAGVMTYIRSSFGNDAEPVSRELVAQVRAETADRTEPWTAEELEALP